MKLIGIIDRKTGKYNHSYTCKICKNAKTRIASHKTLKHNLVCLSCHGKRQFKKFAASQRKKVSFRYYSSNRAERANSITAFCNRHPELGKNAKYHFFDVISGRRLHYKGWLLASNKIKLDLKQVTKIQQTLIKKAII